MEPISCSFTITHEYSVHFTRRAFDAGNSLVSDLISEQRLRRVFVAVEDSLTSHFPGLLDRIEKYFKASGIPHEARVFPGGEAAKRDDAVVNELYRAMESAKICRHSCVAAVGGGAFLDVVGFAAATFHRGIPHWRFPTTLLAQADAGVGVKNGINFAGKKNLVGTFAPPRAVINDLDFLSTLDPRDLRAGLSEAVKVGLIRDADFFEWIETAADKLREGIPAEIETLARRCAELHVRHIATGGDPFEQGSRRPLDFGHWAAHKLEQMSGFELRHGEAVAIGIALDSVYAAQCGKLGNEELQRILALLERLGLPVYSPLLVETGELLNGLNEFREHLGGDLCITLLHGIGKAHEVNQMDMEKICESVQTLKERGMRR